MAVTMELSRASAHPISGQVCPNCGVEGHNIDARFCRLCGHKL